MDNSKNNINAAMTDAEMEAQFVERNNNLKNTLGNIADKIDAAATKTQDFINSNAQNTMGVGSDQSTGLNLSGSTTTATSTQPSGILDQTRHRTGWETNADKKLMNSIETDIKAMHSTDAETFEDVAAKMDETFGQNALI